jgi:hypothetical protein
VIGLQHNIIKDIIPPEASFKIKLFLRGVAREMAYYEERSICGSHNSDYEDFIFSDIMPCRLLKSTDVSEEHVASIFSELNSEPSKKAM